MRVFTTINYNGCKCFYIDGPGGSRKTLVYKTIYNLLKTQSKNLCCMGDTGIAATLLLTGKNVYKVLGSPIPLLSDSSLNISVQSKEGQFLRETDVLIWDEATMAPGYVL